MSATLQFGCVAIGGRGLLICGAPGSGKSSLALALIDRGAVLVGDDCTSLAAEGGRLIAAAPPRIGGVLEVRNVGLVSMPVSGPVAVSLVVRLDRDAPRFIDAAEQVEIEGVTLPLVRLWPDSAVLALRAEIAFRTYGLSLR